MSLHNLLTFQLAYCIIGIAFNLISWGFLISYDAPLTPTSPLSGILAMLIFGLFLLAGKFRQLGLYRALMLISIIIFGYGGIIKHILALSQSPELYDSVAVGILAILINVVGFILNGIALLGRYRISKEQ